MKKVMVVIAALTLVCLLSTQALAHQIYIKKNPTNESGIEFGVDNASGFVRWRAIAKGLTNNSRGQNTGWTDTGNGWWYYDVSSITQRVMWRLDGIANQNFVITYWVFKSDGTWEYGPQVQVTSDQILPTASFTNIYNGQTFSQAQFNISVSSSDNLSGVDSIRIYAVVPSGNSLSGWIPSGIANQFYKEFAGTSVSYNFSAPAEGNYTFTLWVKDKASNIAYEPGGPITVIVDLPAPIPPPPAPPNAPSNLNLTISGQNIIASWQDNSSDEDGFNLYRNGSLLKTLAANSTSFVDTGLQYNQSYCYSISAYKGSLSSSAIESCATIPAPPAPDYHYADSFTYPMSCDKIYRIETDAQIPVGACFDYQPFCSLFSYSDECHQGSDLNLKGVNDLGAPVYAIANALVWDYGWTSGWGNYLILRIQASAGKSFNLSDGTIVTEIFVLYGHLNEIKIIKDNGVIIEKANIVKQGTYVAKGWQIGTVGDGNGNFSPHLHFEIRINGYSQLGNGYWPVSDLNYLKYFVDPIEFIENNWLPANRTLQIMVHGYDRQSSRKVFLDLDPALWQRQGRQTDGLPLAAVGLANHIWLTSSAKNTAASWNFHVPQSGAYSLFLIMPRYYGTANNVLYTVWHSSQKVASPYEVRLSQTNNNENKKIYLGTFDYYQGSHYSVDVGSLTSDNPAKNVALDSLILIYEGDLGTGGGPVIPPADPPPDNEIKTVNSAGSLTFKYIGAYSKPELHCSGGGLTWGDAILSGGLTETTVSVIQSEQVICNILFEDGTWLADSQGLKIGEQLLANDQLINATLDNGLGGSNLVFNLIVDGQIKTINSSGTINFTYAGTYSTPELHCSGGGLAWENIILTGGAKQNTATVTQSGQVICNIKFEDGNWLADYFGLMANQTLLVENQEITTLQDNGLGGKNLVFNLQLNSAAPPVGCSLDSSQAVFTWATCLNLLFLFSPLFFLLARKVRKFT
ncbi:MAG: peptidoglycan DD-metalloendopeptidase family protein [Candidatus Parcubacteria bacterium]|nr:peptidoglycan DD-metalloendopeptidase family protein [Candidatus Parcubacteria bacterium]